MRTRSFCPGLKAPQCNVWKVSTALWSASLRAKENSETFVLQGRKPWCCLNTAAIKHTENEVTLFYEKTESALAYSSLERTEPDLLTDGPNSSAKLFRELDKIRDKSGLRFIARHNKCFLFLILVMASGAVDCYQSAFRGRSSFPQPAQYRQHQLLKDHEATLKNRLHSVCCWGWESLQLEF